MGCDDGCENSLGPFAGNEEEEWGEVEKRMRMRTTRGKNEDDPEGSGVEDDPEGSGVEGGQGG